MARPDNLTEVAQYGITNAVELANAKALQTGRLAMGSGIVFMASQKFMSGELTGNGPTDRQKRQAWIDAGYIPRSIKINDAWISYDAFEPFNQVLTLIADAGDNSLLMGEEWTEDQFQKTALVIAQGLASKSYLAGMQQFVELFSGKPGQGERIAASLINNTVPLGSLRNDIGKLLTPYTRELASGIDQSLRNRNLITENIAGTPLPIKYDLLTGRPIKDHDFMTRAFNMFSPVNFNLDHGEGKRFFFESGYDARLITFFSPDGDDLTKYPEIRSDYQQAIGVQNLEAKLAKLSRSRKVQESLAQMYFDIRSGKRAEYEAKDYYHNIMMHKLIREAREIAWLSIKDRPNIEKLRVQNYLAGQRKPTTTTDTLISMYK